MRSTRWGARRQKRSGTADLITIGACRLTRRQRALSRPGLHVGFEIPDVWVIGYGRDAAGEGRPLPYVATINPEG